MAVKLRCAIYTRKSTEEGLEQDFNSLHAQREAGEAYVCSQVGEGWTVLPKAYDDGGFSGGSMERPGLRSLLDDIGRGLIDVVVVYKVDRLTRSLTDFAKIVEQFDARGVSFVSVTQAFNTTTSMGRLTLNVLLSFAQFEREVTGERIRDKIAASKAKGMWMGGNPPLGYDVKDRKLVVNETEAATIRHMFARYLQLGSTRKLTAELDAEGVRSKKWITRAGRQLGGVSFHPGSVSYILRNRVYIGEIVHRGRTFAGQHDGLVEKEIFEEVGARLPTLSMQQSDRPRRTSDAVLKGKIFDYAGRPFGPVSNRGDQGRIHRYYVALALHGGLHRAQDMPIRRVSAPALEDYLLTELKRLSGNTELQVSDLACMIARIELGLRETQLIVDLKQLAPDRHLDTMRSQIAERLTDGEMTFADIDNPERQRIIFPRRMQFRGGRTVGFENAQASSSKINRAIVSTLRRAHTDLENLNAAPCVELKQLSEAVAPATQYKRRVARLAYLSPHLQSALLTGMLGGSIDLKVLLRSDMPLDWAGQDAWLARLAGLADGRRG